MYMSSNNVNFVRTTMEKRRRIEEKKEELVGTGTESCEMDQNFEECAPARALENIQGNDSVVQIDENCLPDANEICEPGNEGDFAQNYEGEIAEVEIPENAGNEENGGEYIEPEYGYENGNQEQIEGNAEGQEEAQYDNPENNENAELYENPDNNDNVAYEENKEGGEEYAEGENNEEMGYAEEANQNQEIYEEEVQEVAGEEENVEYQDEAEQEIQPHPPVDITCLSNYDPGSQENLMEEGYEQENKNENGGNVDLPSHVDLFEESESRASKKETRKSSMDPDKKTQSLDEISSLDMQPRKPKKRTICVFQHILKKDNTILEPMNNKELQIHKSEGFKCLLGHFNTLKNPLHHCPYAEAERQAKECKKCERPEKKIGPLTMAQRQEKIAKYQEKKKRRLWNRKVTYSCRSTNAQKKIRIRGRFANSNIVTEPTLVKMGDIPNTLYQATLPEIAQPVFSLSRLGHSSDCHARNIDKP